MLLRPRQVGQQRDALYLDLESPSDQARLSDPELYLRQHRGLLLGSASLDLLRQSSESLAGRIACLELSGLNVLDVGEPALDQLWNRGGFPDSFQAEGQGA